MPGKQPARSRGSEPGPGAANPASLLTQGLSVLWTPDVGEVDLESHSGSGVGGL